MAPSPKISVCIPMYNAALFIKDCINSVLSQSFQDFELLVVDDGSTDNSCDIVKNIKDNRVRLIQNQHDYVGSLNLLMDEAKGEYIAKMDADDVMCANRLTLQYEYMENHPDVDFIGGRMAVFKQSTKEPLYDLNVKLVVFASQICWIIVVFAILQSCSVPQVSTVKKNSVMTSKWSMQRIMTFG